MAIWRVLCYSFLRNVSSCLSDWSCSVTFLTPSKNFTNGITWRKHYKVLTKASHCKHICCASQLHRIKQFQVDSPDRISESKTDEDKSYKIFGSKTMNDFKNKLKMENVTMTSDDWDSLRNVVLEENPNFSKLFDVVIMQLLCGAKQISLGIEFVELLEKQEKQLHFIFWSNFIALCGTVESKKHQHHIFEAYKKIEQQTKLYDPSTCNHLIRGFCWTDQWKKSLQFLEMSKISKSPSPQSYNFICRAALREGDMEIANELLVLLGENYMLPSEDVFFEYIKQCQQIENDLSIFEFFHYLRRFFWFPSQPVAESIEKYFLTCPGIWRTSRAIVNNRGICGNCGSQLQRALLTVSEFQHLLENFADKVIYGQNIYFKSSPEELARFQNFVSVHGPFDVVLDALNIVYIQSRNPKIQQLTAVVRFFSQHEKVLVIGRVHMLKWNRRALEEIESRANTFYTDNVSNDDLFLLYAALLCGKNAKFVSRDEMRDHKFLLDQSLQETFQKWQRSHQIRINYISANGYVEVSMPCHYNTAAQEDKAGCWHIPYLGEEESKDRHKPSFEHPKTFLCIQNMDAGRQNDTRKQF